MNYPNDTLSSLFTYLKIDEHPNSASLDALTSTDHKYLKDVKINVTNVLQYEQLTKKESHLLALAVSINEKNAKLIDAFTALSKEQEATESELAEIHALVSLMNINNVFYRFRHFTNQEYYNQTPAGIKMSIMMNPVLGKEFFELVSLVISAVNGCEMCVNAHEASVRSHGASQAKVYEAVRLGAVIKGFTSII